MEYILVALYCLSLLLIFLFSLGQLHLAWHYLRRKGIKPAAPPAAKVQPMVTVQLPIYNERYVVRRLIDAVCQFDYPKDKLEIQVLDDSTDETVEILAEKISEWSARGINIKHIKRAKRVGYKAGALQYGLDIAEGEYIAIFDADFIPNVDFLQKTLSQFTPETGLVQTRWGHLNRDYCNLTKIQAFGLDAHFSIEQSGRNKAGSFINFNGTGGVWRKKCIYDAGGWSADTLTEDLDLSYRAQLKGWQFRYLEDYTAPAELPVIMSAVKSQQYRWNKGAAETAKKNLMLVLNSKQKLSLKIHAILHLFNSAVYLCLLLAAVLSVPMLFLKYLNPELDVVFHLGTIFLLGFFSIALFYWISARKAHPVGTGLYYIKVFPVFLIVSMGMSLHNGLAVIEGFLGVKTPFIRTPKFNIVNNQDGWKENVYIRRKLSLLTIVEGFFALYFVAGIAVGIYLNDWVLMIFHIMLAIGFASVFYYSVKPNKNG